MNKKLIYSLIAGTMFTLTSCDDFLDVQPASGFTPEYIFSSESEMKALMTRIYSSMTEDGLYGSNLASGLNTNTVQGPNKSVFLRSRRLWLRSRKIGQKGVRAVSCGRREGAFLP